MAKKVLLVSESQVKNQSIMEQNVDVKVLSKIILNVQEIHLKGILGSTLYNELIDAVELKVVSGTTLSATHQTLLEDYIHPYLINEVIAEFAVVNHFKLTNKGLLKMNDNEATSVNPDELEYFKDYFDNNSSQFKQNLLNYLKDNNLIESCKSNINTTSESIGWFLN